MYMWYTRLKSTYFLAHSPRCLPPAGFVISERVLGRLSDSPIFQAENAICLGRVVDDQMLCGLARTSDADRQGGREPWRWTQVVGGIDWRRKRRLDISVQYSSLFPTH